MALFACTGCGKIKPGSHGRSGQRMPWRCQEYPDCKKLKKVVVQEKVIFKVHCGRIVQLRKK